MSPYKNLVIWQQSCQIATRIYELTQAFPESEKYSLSNQLRRAAVSIPSNIAEGSSRRSNKDFARYIEIAIGSSFELETQLYLSSEFNFILLDDYVKLSNEIQTNVKQMSSFKNHLLLTHQH